MAEIFDEYDQPSPCSVGFCQQIPIQDFDELSAHSTQAALHGLIDHLESNPEEFYKIIRRKKADNLKMFRFVQVKVMNKLQDGYLEKCFPDEQCQEELENLKREMASAYDYQQDGKRTGLRFSRRLAARRNLRDPIASSTPRRQPVPSAPPPPVPPPPPPPPPPPVSNMSVASISPVTLKRLTPSDTPGTPSGTFCQQDKLLQSIRNIGPRRKLREINSAATVPSEYSADPANNSVKKHSRAPSVIEQEDIAAARNSLKTTRPTGSPDESPYQLCKARRLKENEQLQGENYSLFNMELLRKFKNTRSPSSSPSGNILLSDSGFESPQ